VSVAVCKRTTYDDAVDAELARWPGVAWTREVRGKHYALVLTFNGVSRFVVYPCSPGDSRRGALNHLTDVKAACLGLGANRLAVPKSARITSKSRAAAPEIKLATRDAVRLDTNPFDRLADFKVEPKAAAAPPAKPSLWRRIILFLAHAINSDQARTGR
jgi:hypothetical protein